MRLRRELIEHGAESLRFLQLELQEFRNPRHHHRHVELTWIEQGRGLRWLGDEAASFGPGELVLVGPHLPHTWLSEPHPDWPWLRASVLQFEPERLTARGWPELARTRPVLEAAARGLAIVGGTRERITAQLRAMRGGTGLGRLSAFFDILDALAGGGSELQPLCAAPARARTGAAGARVGEVLAWIQHNLGRQVSVAEVSRLACVSEAAFSRYFRREVGRPFTAYVNDLRCSESQVLLRQTPLSVEAIAQRCGFGAVSNFNRQFQRRTGLTPRAYRSSDLV